MTSLFNDIKISGETEIANIKDVTGGDVNPVAMIKA